MFHSHSRFCRNEYESGKIVLLSVVSIWNTLTCSATTLPMRQALECRAEALWSMNDRLATMVLGLWWWLAGYEYGARPMATDLWPPSMATRLTLT